jgi:lipoyl(octanoyl) transferase
LPVTGTRGDCTMQNTQWRFLNTGFQSGASNMDVDRALAADLLQGRGVPTVRVYQWRPWAVSLGQHQRLLDIDTGKCLDEGIDIVRRPTGGRAILHAQELTYSVVMYAGRRGILDVYNEISRALVGGLMIYGIEATLQRSQPNFNEQYRKASSIPCFASSARYEIEWRGRKLVGSAQRRYGDDVVLQHGSILCGPAHRRLADYLTVKEEEAIADIRRDLHERTVDIEEISGRPARIEDLAGCMREGFERAWSITFLAPALPVERPATSHDWIAHHDNT